MALLPAPDPPPTDGVVVLRGWRESDVPALVQACNDPEIQRWNAVPEPYTEKHAHEWVAGIWSHVEPPGDRVTLAIAAADADDELLGAIGIQRLERGAKGEIGYWCAPWARGRGAITRAVRLLADWSFRELDLKRVEMYIAVPNEASHRVAERAGFIREGTLRSFRENKGVWHDHVAWSLLPGELP